MQQNFLSVAFYGMLTPEEGGTHMQQVIPSYYEHFRCIGGACQHNCCIGWEIDIDDETAARYRQVNGTLGCRLQKHIAIEDGVPHFVLDDNERCPFLNQHNLCDIILELGEEALCNICTDHPRFRNELPGRVEIGLGLCCEEAARLILGEHEPTTLIGNTAIDDDILILRDEVIAILQDRSHTIPQRVEAMLARCGAALPPARPDEWASFLLTLEQLEPSWTTRSEQLRDSFANADLTAFDAYMVDRQTEYEQLLVYFVYRHLANAADADGVAARAAFAALGYTLIRALGAVQWSESGRFTFEDQVELARQFSAEIEYSDENLYILLDQL